MPSRLKQLLRVLSVGEEGQWLVSVKDISLEGVGLVSRRPFPIGSVIALELQLRNAMLCRSARVRNLRSTGERRGVNPTWTVGCLFVEPLSAGDIAIRETPGPQPNKERRGKPRYSARFEKGQCRVNSMVIEGPWEMKVQNVSETGIGLVSDRPFKAGMFLTVELPGSPPQPMMLRVVHASKQLRTWLVGCEFPRRLTTQEMRALT
jgi:hypothetical protein